MQTLEGLKRRIKTTTSLKDIVSSMKTLSMVSVGQYEKSTKALKQYSESIELSLLALIRGRSIPPTIQQKLKEKKQSISLPLDFKYRVKQIKVEKCKVMKSKKKPLWLVFKNSD